MDGQVQLDMFMRPSLLVKPQLERRDLTGAEMALVHDLNQAAHARGSKVEFARSILIRASSMLSARELPGCAAYLLASAHLAMSNWKVYRRHGRSHSAHPTATILSFARRAASIRRALDLPTVAARPPLPRSAEDPVVPLHRREPNEYPERSADLYSYRRSMPSRWWEWATATICVAIAPIPVCLLVKGDAAAFWVRGECFPDDPARTQHCATIRTATLDEAVAAAEKWILFANDLFDLAIEDAARRAGEVS